MRCFNLKGFSSKNFNKKGLATFSCTNLGSKLNVFMKIQLNQPIYTIDYYNALKEYMTKVIDIQNNTVIVLEKI